MIRLVCGNCGKISRFESWDDASQAGWDTLATVGYNACERCPGLAVHVPMLYAQQARGASTPEERDELLVKAAAATLVFPPKSAESQITPSERLDPRRYRGRALWRILLVAMRRITPDRFSR